MTDSRSYPESESANWVLHKQPADQIADHKFSIWSGEHPVVLANEVPGEEGALAYIVDVLNRASSVLASMSAVWLRNVGDEDECWVPCAKGDVGAVCFVPAQRQPDHDERRLKADYQMGWWMAAALEDPKVCAEMKAVINEWFEAHQPGLDLHASAMGALSIPSTSGGTAA